MEPQCDKRKWPKAFGHTHTQAQVVDFHDLSCFFENLGFRVINLHQRWRHVHGVVKTGNQRYFLKLASTPEIGQRTENEMLWNRRVSDRLLKLSYGKLVVPKIYRAGRYRHCFYYLADFYDGDFLADHDPPRTRSLARHISSIATIALCLNRLRHRSLWIIGKNTGPKALAARFLKEVDRWRHDSGRRDLTPLLKLVQPLEAIYAPRIAHGDFVPWHLISCSSKIILIDGEHAWSGRPRYYDAAYFYHRVSTSAARPDLAQEFIRQFLRGLPAAEQNTFEEYFVPVLAARSIAGFYDVKLFEDQKKVLGQHEELKANILAGKIW